LDIVFGPVPSRRYSVSLGIDIIPLKTCTFSCVYCEVGNTTDMRINRFPFVLTEDVINELHKFFANNPDIRVDYITFAGSGEPTLNTEMGRMIRAVKKRYTDIPVAVLTNGALLWMKEVREELLSADVVEASLDAAIESTYIKLNRPHKSIILDLYISGLKKFRQVYTNKYYLEIMFVRGINDNEKNLAALKREIQAINPDKVHLNTIARPPAEPGMKPVPEDFLIMAKDFLGEKAEVVASFEGSEVKGDHIEKEILKAVIIRPMRFEEILVLFDIDENVLRNMIDNFKKKGEVKEVEFNGEKYIQGVRYKRDISRPA